MCSEAPGGRATELGCGHGTELEPGHGRTFLGSNTPAFFRVSQAMGTVELTGLEMISTTACGDERGVTS